VSSQRERTTVVTASEASGCDTCYTAVIFFVSPIDREQRVLNMSEILYHF